MKIQFVFFRSPSSSHLLSFSLSALKSVLVRQTCRLLRIFSCRAQPKGLFDMISKNLMMTPQIVSKSVTIFLLCLACATFLFKANGQVTQNATNSSDYICVSRGPDWKLWQKIVLQTNQSGVITTNLHSYKELGTGLCYLQNGQYVDSVEQIVSVADGAQAVQGRHQVHWATDANTPGGAVHVTTADGNNLFSTVLGIAYYDTATGSNATIALLKDCNGAIVAPNQMLYADAFTNLRADLQYTYSKAGLSQDVILRQALLPPGAYGLFDKSTILQVYTEFFNSPDPEFTTTTNEDIPDANVLDFGDMKMGIGHAIFLRGNESAVMAGKVAKQWIHANNRTFLIESIPYDVISAAMQNLPHASNLKPSHGTLRRIALLESRPQQSKQIAHVAEPPRQSTRDVTQPQLLIDYELLHGNYNLTLQGDTTYLITSEVSLGGTLTIEGGAIIKYTNAPMDGLVATNIVCQTGEYRPAIFTSMNDNSVGDTINGSTGTPVQGSPVYLYDNCPASHSFALTNLRFSYANIAIFDSIASYTSLPTVIENCQFVQCHCGLFVDPNYGANSPQGVPVNVYNTLFSRCYSGIDILTTASSVEVDSINVTADQIGTFFAASTNNGCCATNCLFTAVTNLSAVFCTDCVSNTTGAGIYQTVGAASYYLVQGSTNRGAGTTNIDPALLADLEARTTYPPTNVSGSITSNCTLYPVVSRDASGSALDLGYHYDPLDYAISVVISNAEVTVYPGTALGLSTSIAGTGIWLQSGAMFNSFGTPLNPNYITPYNAVQEQSNTNWEGDNQLMALMIGAPSGSSQVSLLFTVIPVFEGQHAFCSLGSEPYQSLFRDCQFYNGAISGGPVSLSMINCLFQRMNISLNDNYVNGISNSFCNNLFQEGEFNYQHWPGGSDGVWTFRDNLFDQTSITSQLNAEVDVSSNNAYVGTLAGMLVPTNSSVALPSSPVFQIGPLGNYYYPANQPRLINGGSRCAAAAGLYHYTVTTNNVIDGSNMVTIGFHYVATDASGIPLDTTGGGIPDYYEDLNGTNCTVASTNPALTLTTSGGYGWPYVPVGAEVSVNATPDAGLPGLEMLTTVTNCDLETTVEVPSGTSIISNWWEATGQPFTGWGNGLTATFVPTNGGSGQLVFNLEYQEASCCGGGVNLVSATNTYAIYSNLPVDSPQIIVQPASQTVSDGTNATFAVVAEGGTPMVYQWQKFDSGSNSPTYNNWTNIPNATNTSFTVYDVQAPSAGNYIVIVTNPFGQIASAVASLTDLPTAPVFTVTPISQTVVEHDTVTFGAKAIGTDPVSYQWQLFSNGGFCNLAGQTNCHLVDVDMQPGDGGTYAVVVSNCIGTNVYTNAILTDASQQGNFSIRDSTVMPVFGPRQDYTFQAYRTYYIAWGLPASNGDVFLSEPEIDLYGTTVIQGGAVLKFDYDEFPRFFGLPLVAGLILHGSLICETGPYQPAIFTSVDDDSQGDSPVVYWYPGVPTRPDQDCSSGVPTQIDSGSAYLNLDDVDDTNATCLSYLRFCYADKAVTTPTNSGKLEIWNCQFLDCNSALNSHQTNGACTNSLHNVLFSLCNDVIEAATNNCYVDGEQVTADAGSFWFPDGPPAAIRLTNSIILAEFGEGPALSNQNVIVDPATWPFVAGHAANYYLPPSSFLHRSGTTNISASMLQQLSHKTTDAPISFACNQNVNFVDTEDPWQPLGLGINEMTLFPVVKRYQGGLPDIGYYYDPVDYTVAAMMVTNRLSILPGTVVAFRNDYLGGFFLQDGATLNAQGSPTNPIVLTDIALVQEGPFAPGWVYQAQSPWYDYAGNYFYYGGIDFICPQAGNTQNPASPTVNLRFCNAYGTASDYLMWSGELGLASEYGYSAASSVYWTMRDCAVHGGQIVLGPPLDWEDPDNLYPPGSVSWTNNLFDTVGIYLNPSYSSNDLLGNDGTTNVDLPVSVCNNLFISRSTGGATWPPDMPPTPQAEIFAPSLTSKGAWVFRNNLFDCVTLVQNTNRPLAADHNAYWNVRFDSSWVSPYIGCWQALPELANTVGSGGLNSDKILTDFPPYQAGPFGNYYMASGTALAGAGSTNANLLGFYYYTSATNQTLEETTNVDIGLLYVAASESTTVWQPLATNGIPDYLADVNGNGNIPSAATNASGSYYANIDLDGDGMVGIVESNLHENPLIFDNPLTLNQVITGQEPGLITFVVSNSFINAAGQLELIVNGAPVTTSSETDGSGNPILIWNTATNIPNRPYYLQARFVLNSSVVTADGPLISYFLPAVMVQPSSQTNGQGGTATIVSATTGPGPYTYQWYQGTNLLTGATNSYLTLTNLTTNDSGTYNLVVVNPEGVSFATNAILEVSSVEIGITVQPLSQFVYEPDTVTFSVVAVGSNLNYQWTALDGCSGAFTNIPGATNQCYTINNIKFASTGVVATYSVLVSNTSGSIQSSGATLTDGGWTGWYFMPVVGPRQDYTFRGNATYLIGHPWFGAGPVDLYGRTTLEGGAILKFDYGVLGNVTGLNVHGSLNCTAGPYRPLTMTSMDDDSQGEAIGPVWDNALSLVPGYVSTSLPQTAPVDTVYLNLDDAHSSNTICITNLRVFYADQAITTPTNSGTLEVWDSQFCGCNEGISSRRPTAGSTNRLHNVLFARCGSAIATWNENAEVDAEQVTADVVSFCDLEYYPARLNITNSIIVGSVGDGPVVQSLRLVNPSTWPFQSVNDGNYYLPNNSPYRTNGTTNLSLGMLADLSHKTTCGPISFPTNLNISGQITLFPQCPRYTSGPPDLGYAYDPLDYTISDLNVLQGTITVLRGAALGIRNDFVAGFNLSDNSVFTSVGTPNQPIIFTDNTLVQDGPFAPGQVYNEYLTPIVRQFVYYNGPAFFVANPSLDDNLDAAPQINMRFCKFYMTPDDLGIAAGYSLLDDNGFAFSYASSVLWTLQDCEVYGGQIALGDQSDSVTNAAADVSWINCLFDETAILLQPSYNTGTNTPYVDFPFQAYNNDFKDGSMVLDPTTTSQGNWILENNLFDGMQFYQNAAQPLDHDYNAYWTNAAFDLLFDEFVVYNGFTTSDQLAPASSDNGSTDGSNDKIFTSTPPYQSGPFGNFYMAPNTVLANSGGTTADQLGLYHYTTAIDQIVQGNSPVDIGLHYLAASNGPAGWVPLDTDGDGIPDYVEDANGNGIVDSGETDPTTQYTVPGVWDPTNSVYDGIDLSGNGLVGDVKRALGMAAFGLDNPLVLKEAFTGQEPSMINFNLPLQFSTLTQAGHLILLIDGLEVSLFNSTQAPDGTSTLVWNSTYDTPGQHYMQAELTLNDTNIPSGSACIACGPVVPFFSSNILQFFLSDSLFNTQTAFLDAQLPQSAAAYTIKLYDPSVTPPALVTTINGATTTGFIEEDWGVTNADGSPYLKDTVNAQFNVALAGSASGNAIKTLNRFNIGVVEGTPKFDLLYVYTPQDNTMQSAFDTDGSVWEGMLNVVDTLTMPNSTYVTYNSGFDQYSSFSGDSLSYPGYASSMEQITNSVCLGNNGLFADMADPLTEDFYCYTHGSEASIFDSPHNVSISTSDIANLLGNQWSADSAVTLLHPYRFVFMDCCFSAANCSSTSGNAWTQAFGILPFDYASQQQRSVVGDQAFVGWAGEGQGLMEPLRSMDGLTGLTQIDQEYVAQLYTQTLDYFYFQWMNGNPVVICLAEACSARNVPLPFPIPRNKRIYVPLLGFYIVNQSTGPLCVIGHKGLTISTLDVQYDTIPGFSPPTKQ